jgi:hypothetical protein
VYLPRFGTKKREALYQREELAAHFAGRGQYPICNLCDLPVMPGQAWDESHVGAPKSLGGTSTGIAHRRCNHEHGAAVVTPMVAKAKRNRRKHVGIAGVGLGRHPLPAGVRTKITKTMLRGVQPRLTLSERLDALRKRRGFGLTDEAVL